MKVTTSIRVEIAQIAPLSSDMERWDDFVFNHAAGTFFHRFSWSQVIKQTMGHEPVYLMALCKTSNAVRGVLPLSYLNSPLFGRALISTAFTVGGGLLTSDEEAAALLLEKAIAIGREFTVNYIELRGGEQSVLKGWARKDDIYAGFIQKIEKDEEVSLKNIPRKKRADIRKGIKAAQAGKLQLRQNAPVKAFYKLYAESVRNLGTPIFSLDFIKMLRTVFTRDVEITVVEAGGQPVAGLVSFYYKDTVLPYYGGARPAARRLHAYDYLYWSQMRLALDRGVAYFDFGRSKYGTGAFDYKCHWGFEPVPLSYAYYLIGASKMPNINPKNPKFALMTKIWQKLPLPIANTLGPYVARHLG